MMMTLRLAAVGVCIFVVPKLTFAQSLEDCRKMTSAIERLDCYDKLPATAAPNTGQPAQPAAVAAPKPPLSADEQLIAKAKARVRQQLKDPSSAQFTDMKVRPGPAGKKGVCGMVNAKNAFGGFTGPKIFVYDGTNARILISSDGAENSTSFDRILLGVMLGDSLKMHDRFCK